MSSEGNAMAEQRHAKRGWSLPEASGVASAVVGRACLAALALLLLAPTARAQAPGVLRIRATGTPFTVGTVGRYTLSIRNESGIHADRQIRVISELPAGLNFVEGYGRGWVCAGRPNLIDCWTTDLAPKQRKGLTVKVGVSEEAAPKVITTFKAFYEDASILTGTSTSRITKIKPSLVVIRTATPTPTPTLKLPCKTPRRSGSC